MQLPLENVERRKKRDPEIYVWAASVRCAHWLLAFSFAALYLEYRKFPLHPYAGYLILLIVLWRIAKGFLGSGAARFSTFWFSPAEMLAYFRQALRGRATYHFSHNPMGAAMVYTLLVLLLADTVSGLLLYSAGQQLGPFQALIPVGWEDGLIWAHHRLGHLTAILVCIHIAGVVWATWLHRENYVMSMLTGIRRIPRAVPIPPGTLVVVKRAGAPHLLQRIAAKLTYGSPMLGSLFLIAILIGAIALPLIEILVRINKVLPAY